MLDNINIPDFMLNYFWIPEEHPGAMDIHCKWLFKFIAPHISCCVSTGLSFSTVNVSRHQLSQSQCQHTTGFLQSKFIVTAHHAPYPQASAFPVNVNRQSGCSMFTTHRYQLFHFSEHYVAN